MACLLFRLPPVLDRHFWLRSVMDTELLGIVLGAVLPLYPLLFAIYQKIGKYDEVVEEFKKLQDEHEHHREEYHGQ